MEVVAFAIITMFLRFLGWGKILQVDTNETVKYVWSNFRRLRIQFLCVSIPESADISARLLR